MPNKKLNYFRTGDLLKVKKNRNCKIQTGLKRRDSEVTKGATVVFLSSKLGTKLTYHMNAQGDYGESYSVIIKIMDQGMIKIFDLAFDQVYTIFKLVQKA